MKLLLAVIVVGFPIACTAFQCYQCIHTESDQDPECINADIKYLQNCTTNNHVNNDFTRKYFGVIVPVASMSTKQFTEWSCRELHNYTTTAISVVIRECIPRLDLNSCTSTGSFTENSLECVCVQEGCNKFVVTVEDTTTTSTTIQMTSTTNSDEDSTSTTIANGGSNIKLQSLATYYFLIFVFFFTNLIR